MVAMAAPAVSARRVTRHDERRSRTRPRLQPLRPLAPWKAIPGHLWIAAIEGLLYVVHALHWWEAVGLAALGVLLLVVRRPESRSDLVRQMSWVFAVSQLLVLCVPIALTIVTAFAIGIVALLAIAALIFLFTERP